MISLDIFRADFYEKELFFQVSCSYGPGRYDESYENKGEDPLIPFYEMVNTTKASFAALESLKAGMWVRV